MGIEWKLEFQRMCKNKSLHLALLIGAMVTVIQFISVVLPLKDYVMQEGYSYPFSVFGWWIGGEVSSIYSTLYYFLVPILIIIPCAGSYKTDMKSGYIKQIITRTSREKYLTAKFGMTFLTGGIIVVFPLIMNFMLTATVLPMLNPQVGRGYFPIRAFHFLGDWFYAQPFKYLLIFLLLNFVYFGMLATVTLAASYICEYSVTAMMVPFVICLILLGTSELFYWDKLCPLLFLKPSQVTTFSMPVYVSEFLILLFIGGGYFYVGKKRDII